MSVTFLATGRRTSQTNLCASMRISKMLFRKAQSGATRNSRGMHPSKALCPRKERANHRWKDPTVRDRCSVFAASESTSKSSSNREIAPTTVEHEQTHRCQLIASGIMNSIPSPRSKQCRHASSCRQHMRLPIMTIPHSSRLIIAEQTMRIIRRVASISTH